MKQKRRKKGKGERNLSVLSQNWSGSVPCWDSLFLVCSNTILYTKIVPPLSCSELVFKRERISLSLSQKRSDSRSKSWEHVLGEFWLPKAPYSGETATLELHLLTFFSFSFHTCSSSFVATVHVLFDHQNFRIGSCT
jgi:hypothetical protein